MDLPGYLHQPASKYLPHAAAELWTLPKARTQDKRIVTLRTFFPHAYMYIYIFTLTSVYIHIQKHKTYPKEDHPWRCRLGASSDLLAAVDAVHVTQDLGHAVKGVLQGRRLCFFGSFKGDIDRAPLKGI